MRLRALFDEVPHSSDKWENFFEVYERHLEHRMHEGVNLVEVGVQKGGSLDMWYDYFANPKSITGIDIDPECLNHDYGDKNIKVVIGDQGAAGFWDEFLATQGPIDVFIDDGGHYMDQQILTFEKVFPFLGMGGVYICEDTHTSYMPHNGGGLYLEGSFIEYAKDFIDVLHLDWSNASTEILNHKRKLAAGLSGVFFYDSIVVFEKFGKRNMKRVSPRRFPDPAV